MSECVGKNRYKLTNKILIEIRSLSNKWNFVGYWNNYSLDAYFTLEIQKSFEILSLENREKA